jgi:hypothetical protein
VCTGTNTLGNLYAFATFNHYLATERQSPVVLAKAIHKLGQTANMYQCFTFYGAKQQQEGVCLKDKKKTGYKL